MRTRKLDACNFATINGHERKEEQKIVIVRCSDTAREKMQTEKMNLVDCGIHAAELCQKGMSIVLNK